MNYEEFYQKYQEMAEKATSVNLMASDILEYESENNDGKIFYGRGEIACIEPSGVTFSYVHNVACNCHPEYVTASYLIPEEWIDLPEDELRRTLIAIRGAREKASSEAVREAAIKKIGEEKAKQEAKERAEKEQYLKLKEKFEKA